MIPNNKNVRKLHDLLLYSILFLIGAITLIPFFWMISTAFKPLSEILSKTPTLFPKQVTFEHFKNVFITTPYFINLFNSIFISTITTLIAVFFSTMIGYGIAKYESRGLKIIFLVFLSAMMFPPFIIAIPLYLIATQIGMVDTLWGVIIPFAISNFGIFLMRQYIIAMPNDILDAARIDGASEFAIHKYERYEKAIEKDIALMYLSGLSTRGISLISMLTINGWIL